MKKSRAFHDYFALKLNSSDVVSFSPNMALHLLEECLMVLPGIQALFDFQLMAVFNTTFWGIPVSSRMIHLLAIGLVAMAQPGPLRCQ